MISHTKSIAELLATTASPGQIWVRRAIPQTFVRGPGERDAKRLRALFDSSRESITDPIRLAIWDGIVGDLGGFMTAFQWEREMVAQLVGRSIGYPNPRADVFASRGRPGGERGDWTDRHDRSGPQQPIFVYLTR